MAIATDSSSGLTSFPAVFPDEVEKGQVNQVFSSLFKQVKTKLGGYGSTTQDAAAAAAGGIPPRPPSAHSSLQGLGLFDATGRVPPAQIVEAPEASRDKATHQGPTRQDSGHTQASAKPPSHPSSLKSQNRPSLARTVTSSQPAPPLVSTTPVIRSRDFVGPRSYSPDLGAPFGRSRSRSNSNSQPFHQGHAKNSSISSTRFRRPSFSNGAGGGVSPSPSSTLSAFALEQLDYSNVPGFPIADDARSIRTSDTTGGHRKDSVTKIIRRLRGEGLSKTYWMADENCKECYDCRSVFTTWRRKHHCRICGQVLCSRCAPNIIKGHRFGHDGMVRVCNLCLAVMDEEDEEEDRRSVTSTTSHLPTTSSTWTPSPFAASHLFARQPENGLQAISESRGMIPEDEFAPDERGRRRHPLLEISHGENRGSTEAAPFRHAIAEDEQPVAPDTTPSSESKGGTPDKEINTVRFPASESGDITTAPMSREATTSLSSTASAKLPGTLRTRLSSRVSTSGLSGVLLDDFPGDHGVWRSGVDTSTYTADALPAESLDFFKKLLRQALADVPHRLQWESMLLSMLLCMSMRISPDVRAGDLMNVLNYVKVKKIPGGTVTQSEYVDGVVITKNLAHKQMPRHMINPRVMIVTFPLDYHRVDNQFVSLEPLLAQEKNYLRHLTKRVTDLRPHIVLVEKSVSRLALNFLFEAKVSVARGVKHTALKHVARVTRADVIGSMDRLALEPKLGRCAELKVQTFEHPLIPGGRKTFIRFEGCDDELGCTLVLRGGDEETLRKVKRVTEFLITAVYNLRLEASLFYDEFNLFPSRPTEPNAQLLSDGDEADEQSEIIREALRPYVDTILSTSVAVRYPAPAPLARLGKLDIKLRTLRHAKHEAEAERILADEKHAKEGSTETVTAEAEAANAITTFECILRDPAEVRTDSDISATEYELSEQLKFWNWYNSRYPLEPKPELLQKIVYSVATVAENSDRPCSGPTLICREFFGEGDCTLGQYLEALALHAGQPCPNKACTKIMLHHFQVLVHGETRLQIAMDQFPCPSPGHDDKVMTWSYCKICKAASPTSIIKEDTWRFSFAKYLEHSFYPSEAKGGFSCPHDIYRDQIRYFGIHHLAIRIHNEPVAIYDVVRPTLRLQFRDETRVTLKNQEYEAIHAKTKAFFESVITRLKTFDESIVDVDKLGTLKSKLDEAVGRAQEDCQAVFKEIDRTYKLTAVTDLLALNPVYQELQEKVVHWDNELQELEKTYLPSEKDIRRMTAATLKRLFASPDTLSSDNRSVSGSSLSDASEGEAKAEIKAVDPVISELNAMPKLEPAALDDDDAETPMAERPAFEKFPPPPSPDRKSNKSYDSDSTISGVPGRVGGVQRLTSARAVDSSTSGQDTDANFQGFVSKLPRRARPAPSVAELIRRFQNSALENVDELESENAERSLSRSSRKGKAKDAGSDSDGPARPRFRRGKTEGEVRPRQVSRTGSGGILIEADRSYATNASRIPTITPLRLPKPIDDDRGAKMTHAQRRAMARVGKGRAPERVSSPRPDASASPAPTRRHTKTGSRVNTIARHFDKLSREAERDRQRRLQQEKRRPRPVSVAKAKVQVFSSLRDAFRDDSDSSSSSEADDEIDENDAEGEDSAAEDSAPLPRKDMLDAKEPTPPIAVKARPLAPTPVATSLSTTPSEGSRLQITLPPFETNTPLLTVPPTPALHPVSAGEKGGHSSHASQTSDAETASVTQERSSILKTLSGLWAFRAGDIVPLEYPLAVTEHIFTDSKIVVREDEPTSIIAFTLSSKTHRDKMRGIAHQTRTAQKQEQSAATSAEPGVSHDRATSWDMVSLEDATPDPEEPRANPGGTHLNYDFESGTSVIGCRIFFAEQFAQLRAACGCEETFLDSLARCLKWDSSGGKSGSAFLKTKDDRLIAKEVSRLEMDALTKFAPSYFDYMRQSTQHNRPTALAKIYGFFKVGYKNAATGKTMKMNLLIMENLFYERRFEKIYDLKGSTRNRLVQVTGKQNEVLLDENLMEIAHRQPLFLRDHSKVILRTALWNDTLFLSSLNVMDYSLVVGVDAEKQELVVGVVDYIRTFTWDKKLESWIKDVGGAGRGEPTIVTPKQYKTRFRAAMDKYFPAVPDRWSRMPTDAPLVDEDAAQSL